MAKDLQIRKVHLEDLPIIRGLVRELTIYEKPESNLPERSKIIKQVLRQVFLNVYWL